MKAIERYTFYNVSTQAILVKTDNDKQTLGTGNKMIKMGVELIVKNKIDHKTKEEVAA